MVCYSLVIATLHDGGSLEDCLASLAELRNAAPFEVIIVDQNGDDRLVALLEAFAVTLEIVHERVAFRGASRARNHGARLARGAWLGFPDDDCRLLPDALSEVARAIAEQDVHVVTGQTIDEDGCPNVLGWKQQPVLFTRRTMFGCLTEATLFVRRDSFLTVGGFDERFGPGAAFPAAEGIDLMNRLFAILGEGKACYRPQVKMKHPTKIPPWNGWAVSRFHAYAIGDGALIAKNPQPHMLNWGLRTLVSAAIQMFSLRPWRGLAFAARIAGLIRGFLGFHIASWRA